MRTTLNIDDELIKQASAYTGIKEKTSLVRMGLQALIRSEACLKLIELGGTDPKASVAPRNRKSAQRSR